ncbi:uncharacterized protein LOC127260306 isoform X2 [Andrographis paniculata]|uniref:uncharacterized protein LOC127260306 isoform X2 n=1 Tax=Andrographis paniculata TaxID=175694 RepID=UPI0021E80AB8|nr:uncharacterized protein LOC127260306 isoform X2 [Andrographis paniculata]
MLSSTPNPNQQEEFEEEEEVKKKKKRKLLQNHQSNQENASASASGSPTRRLLAAAAYFLSCGNFAECRKYALRARDSDATSPQPARILSIASVLSAPNVSSNLSDYYSILNLSRFESNVARIRSNFDELASTLNPKVNEYPLCSEAHRLVMKAWGVLSSPSEKAKFDDQLRRNFGGCTPRSGTCTFWTVCPYCYYVYEYDGAFKDCSLRCTNERCRRVLHAFEIMAPPPPPEVVERGYYWSPGFVQLASSGDGNGDNMWVPFDCPVSKQSDYDIQYNGNMENTDGNFGEFMGKGSKRRKSHVHWDTKKSMGQGDHCSVGDGNEEEGHSESGFEGLAKDGDKGVVEFFDGEDDVLVAVEDME